MALIYLYRHGKQDNQTGLPPSNIPLSKTANEEAKQWAESCPFLPDIIAVSSYLCSKQSAKPFLSKGLADKIQIWQVHPFCNLSPKKQRGTETQELEQCYWEKCDPEHKDSRDSESFMDFIERARNCISLIAELKDKKIVIISHESFLNAIRWLIKNKNTPINSKSMVDYHQFNKNQPIEYLKGFTLRIG